MIVRTITIAISLCFLSACAVKIPAENKYQLTAFDTKTAKSKQATNSILVSNPIAAAGFDTEQMLYVVKPFSLCPFIKNSWAGTPANMLVPLITQSLQASGYFYAVTAMPYSDNTDYRLDTQLLTLQQNFIVKPSVLDLVIKNVLTNTKNNQIIASRIFSQHLPCPIESPYGGVLAANSATKIYTSELNDFVSKAIDRDKGLSLNDSGK
jgi:cholesterol transport system auxiliary component